MARANWRVQVRGADGLISHSSSFRDDENAARAYYDALDLPGKKELVVRPAGEQRYEIVRFEILRPCGGTGETYSPEDT